jgi:prepilin peptidase CpaA
MSTIGTIGVLAYAALATAWDLHQRRIPNWLSGSALGAAFAVSLLGWGTALDQALIGGALGFGILLLPFTLGVVGGGDVKFVTVVGAWMGPRLGGEALMLGTAAGLGVAVIYAGLAGRLWETIRSTGQLAWLLTATMAPALFVPPDSHKSALAPIPYAVPLSLGVAIAVYLDSHGLSFF